MIQEKLLKGIVAFRYKKADGTTRTAVGTLDPEVIKGIYTAKKTDQAFDLLWEAASLIGRDIVDNERNISLCLEQHMNKIDDLWAELNKKNTKIIKKDDKNITYFDLEAQSFRRFAKDKFIDYI